jgi:hypothetical protein
VISVTRIFCTQCRASSYATKKLGVLSGGSSCWFNVCHGCDHRHPAPPPGLAARNFRQRRIVRRREYLERQGQQSLFTKGNR